jgi:Transcriptional accessory protein
MKSTEGDIGYLKFSHSILIQNGGGSKSYLLRLADPEQRTDQPLIGYLPLFHSYSTDAYVEVLDGSRVHPETYEWARKMAVDALEDTEDPVEDTNPAGALEEILKEPDKLKELDLDAFAEELERQVGKNRIEYTLFILFFLFSLGLQCTSSGAFIFTPTILQIIQIQSYSRPCLYCRNETEKSLCSHSLNRVFYLVQNYRINREHFRLG